MQVIVKEVAKYCEKLIIITEEKNWDAESATFLKENNIQVLFSPNKGYDFGKWYWAFKKIDLTNAERIILLNDSMMLISSLNHFFEWCNNNSTDVKGLLNSNERLPHLQSYFIVLEKKAIQPTINYFKRKKRYRKKRKVIRVYEIGLSIFWKKKKLSTASYHDVNAIQKGFDKNPNYFLLEELLKRKTPLIKRHILMDSFGEDMSKSLTDQNFIFDKKHYLELISENYLKEELLFELDNIKL